MTRLRSQSQLPALVFALSACLSLAGRAEAGRENRKVVNQPPAIIAQLQVAAEKHFNEAAQLRSEQREDSNRKAIEEYLEAARSWRDARNNLQAAVAFRNAGEVLNLLGRSSDALANYTEAFKLAKKASSPLEEARTLNDLAYLHFIVGQTKEAHKNCTDALKKARELHNREIEAEALSNLGEVFYGFGDLEKARENQKHSLAIWTELGNRRGQAIALIALGYYYVNLGEPEKALQSYNDGWLHAQAAHDLAIETLARLAIGITKVKFGQKQEALAWYEAARQLAVRIGDKTSQAIIAGGFGYISMDLGDYRGALTYMEEATRLFELNGKKWGAAETKLDLGRIHRILGNHDKALEYLEEALSAFRSLSMPRLEALTLREIGVVHHARGDTARALTELKRALNLTRVDQDKVHVAYTLNHLGRVYETLKDGNQALACYHRALPLSRAAADPAGEALTLFNLAHLERDRGNLEEARRQVEAALAIVESQRTKVSSQDLRTSYFATVRNTYDLYIDILMLLHKKYPHSGLDALAFAVSEKARARSFLEQLLEARANVRHGVDPALLKKEHELNEALNTKAQLHVQLLTAKQNDEAAKINQELDNLVSELADVREQIRQASPSRATLPLPELLTLKDAQRRVLDDDTVLLEYVLGDDRSYVWIVTRTASFSYELPPRAEIEAAAKRLYKLITSAQWIYGESTSARVDRETKAGAEIPVETALLSKLILGPLAGKLDKKRLLVVADGALQYIPFQLLHHPGSVTPLISEHEIVYLPSVSTLAVLQAEAAGRKPAVNSVAVLADPVFEIDDPRVKLSSETKSQPETATTEVRQALRDVGISPDGVQIPRLIASGAEADGIMSAVPWRTGLKAVGFAATRERVLGSELASYRIVHFATHGIINSEHPELSGIVLSLFDSEGHSQNGFLRLHDIYNLRLPADLVVLSACSTGLGKEVRGEGLIGLTRGFMYAGASGVIASLWKVDDDATAELMKNFYEAMFQKGMSPAAALRESQLALSQQKRWQSPYYWAGFVIQGQYTGNENFTEPFPNKTQIALLGTIGGLLLLASIFVIRRRRRDI
jgi:CHAT domain-containing protein